MNGILSGNAFKRKLHMKGIVMFGKNKEKERKVTVVTTKEQLKAAVNRKDTYIEVKGDLAKKMNWMAKLSKKKIAMIAAWITAAGALATAPATGGASLAVAGVASADVIAVVIILGGIVVIAILNNYDIEADAVNKVLKLTKNK